MSTKKIKQALDAAIVISFFGMLGLFFILGEFELALAFLGVGAVLVLVDYCSINK